MGVLICIRQKSFLQSNFKNKCNVINPTSRTLSNASRAVRGRFVSPLMADRVKDFVKREKLYDTPSFPLIPLHLSVVTSEAYEELFSKLC